MAIQSETVKKYFRKLTDDNAAFDALSDEQKRFVNHVVIDNYNGYRVESPIDIPRRKIDSLSDFVRERFGAAVEILVPQEFIGDYYAMLDKFNQLQYSESYYRRSFRSSDYYHFLDRMYRLTYSCFLLGVLGSRPHNMDLFVLKKFKKPLDAVGNNRCG